MMLYLLRNRNVVGPYSESELRDMILHREITSDTPACRAGEAEWSTVETILGPDPSSQATSQQPGGRPIVPLQPAPGDSSERRPKSPPADSTYVGSYLRASPLKKSSEELLQESTPSVTGANRGIGRLTFFLCDLANGGLVYFFGTQDDLLPGTISLVLSLILSGLRFSNIGKSAWWTLIMLVPIVNIYYGILLLVAPPGYQTTKRLDGIGRILLYLILAFFAVILLFIAIALLAALTGNPGPSRSYFSN